MKKALQTLLLLLMAMLPMTASANVMLGDVNQDGHVNISDVTSLINYLLSKDAGTYSIDNADTNRDGSVTIADVTLLISSMLNN